MEKTLTFHNILIPIKPVGNKNESNCYCNIFLETGSYENKPNAQYV